MKEKFNGVLLHIGSLPSEYGVGALSEGAFSFVDFLADAKVDFWQTLPLSPTSFGDSPYQSPSAFAGNPYFIDINTLVKRGLLTENEAKRAKTKSLDYAEIFNSRYDVLRCAFKRFQKIPIIQSFLKITNIGWTTSRCLWRSKSKTGFRRSIRGKRTKDGAIRCPTKKSPRFRTSAISGGFCSSSSIAN